MNNFYYESFRDAENIIFAKSRQTEDITSFPNHFHRCIEILYIKSGKLKCEIADEIFYADKDDIIFVRKNTLHSLESIDKDMHITVLIGPKYSSDFDFMFTDRTIPSYLNDKNYNKSLLPLFENISAVQDDDTEIIKKGYICLILGNLFKHYPHINVADNEKLNIILKSINYIDQHYSEDISLDSIAKEFNYSKFYFSHLFHEKMGINIKIYINLVRLNNVVNYMRKNEDATLIESVLQNGFKSMATYYRILKEYNQSNNS